jgi:hypothetical protein
LKFNFNEETSGIKQEWSFCVLKFALKPHITFNNIHSRQTIVKERLAAGMGTTTTNQKQSPNKNGGKNCMQR